MGVAVAPSDHTRVYLITGESLGNDKGFFVSDNGDRSLADGGPTFVAGGHAGGNPRFEWWFGRLFVDPVNKDHLFKTDVSLRRSSDGGTTWANVGGPHADQHAMAWDPNVANRVYLGDDGGMYRSDANGDSGWVHGTNMPWLQEYHVAISQQRPNRIAIGLQDNGSNATYNGPGDVADPVATAWNALPSGGDGHYVVIDQQDDTYTYSCSQNAGCSGRHDLTSTTTTLSAAAAVGATNVKLASVTGLVAGNTITIDSTGANPETVTMTVVGTSGASGTGVTFTPALAFAHASGVTVVKNGVAGTQNLELRLARERPALHDRRAGGHRPERRLDALPRLQQPLALDQPRGKLDADRRARPAHRALPAGRQRDQQPALRGPVRDRSRRSAPASPSRTRSTSAPTTAGSGRRPTSARPGRSSRTRSRPTRARWVTSVIVDPVDASHAYASYGGFRQGYNSANVYETTIAGGGATTWHNISGNLPNAPVNFLAYDRANDTLYAATDLGVFFMQGDSKDWFKLGDNLPNTATEDVKLQASSGKLYVATFGRGTWRIPLVAARRATTRRSSPTSTRSRTRSAAWAWPPA